MPVKECMSDGKPGYKWGDAPSSKCYTYAPGDARGRAQAKLKAYKQGMAAGEAPTGGDMSDNGVGLHITMADTQIDGHGFSWIEVMPIVEKARNGPYYFTVSAGDLSTLTDYIAAHPDQIMVDYDHAGSEKNDTRAAGWFTGKAQVIEAGSSNPAGETQDRPSVWAEVKWTPMAVEEIRGGVFRYLSPEWHFSRKDSKTGLMTKLVDLGAATLTNRPFFKDLAPVKAVLMESEQIDALTETYGSEIAELVLAASGVEEEPLHKAVEAVLAAIASTSEEDGTPSVTDQGDTDDTKETTVADDQPVTDYMKMLGLDETVDPKHRLAAAFREKDEKILTLEQKVTELTAAGGDKTKEAEELASRVEELEQKDRERDISVLLTRAVDKGRILPAEKETLTELFAKDVNGLKRLIATRPENFVGDRMAPQGTGSEPDRFVDDPDVAQFAGTSTFKSDVPVDTEQAKQHLVAMEILKEKGKTQSYTDDEYVEAYEQAKTAVY